MMKSKRVIVLGAGVSGLTAAYALTRRGFEVVVLEKNDYVGGLSSTFAYKNYRLDFGPHNFHTHLPGIIDFVRDELGIRLKSMPIRSSKLFFRGRFINYPFRFIDIFKNLGWWFSFKCFVNYVTVRIKLRLLGHKSKGTFEDWVQSRYGSYLYDLYFGPYVKKIWGIPASEIDEVVAKKRMPEPSLLALIVHSLTGLTIGNKHPEDPRTFTSYYIPEGIGLLSETLSQRITGSGGLVRTGCEIEKIELAQGNNYVTFSYDGKQFTIESGALINTIPLNEFVNYIVDAEKSALKQYVERLSYRSIVLLFMFLNVEKLFDDPWVYFNEGDNPDLIFNRISEIGNFSKEMLGPNKEGVLCLEITCYKNDELWNSPDAKLYEKCISYLEKRGFMKRELVREFFAKRVDTAYPVFRKGYKDEIRALLNELLKIGDIFCIGRQGLFTYTNMDHCLDMGLKMGELLDSKDARQRYEKIIDKYLG